MRRLEVSQTLTVQDDSLDPQTITWTQDLWLLSFGFADLNMTASATSRLAITYSSSDETVVKVVNSTYLQTIGQGSATVTASQSGNGQWSAALSVDKNRTVTKANQEIRTLAGSLTLPNFNKDSGDFVFGGHLHAVKQGTNVSDRPSHLVWQLGSFGRTSCKCRNKTQGRWLAEEATITASQAGSSGYNGSQ